MSEVLCTVLNDINAVQYVDGHVYFGASDKAVYKSKPGDHKSFEKARVKLGDF